MMIKRVEMKQNGCENDGRIENDEDEERYAIGND